MKITKLDNYLRHIVFQTVFFVLLIIVGLDAIFALVDELNDLKGSYQAPQALMYVICTIPRRFYDYIAMSALVGCLIGVGSLATTSELVIMRTAGISINRIAWSILKPTILLIIIGTLFGEFIAPVSERYAENQRAIAEDSHQAVINAKQGYWHREGNQYIYINTADSKGNLYGVNVYQFNDNYQMETNTLAKRAIHRDDHWEMRQVTVTEFTDDEIDISQFKSMNWNLGLSPDLLSIVVMDPEDLSMRELYNYYGYLDKQGLDSGEYELAFWQKLFQPMAGIALVILGISFIFGPLRSGTFGLRLFAGIVIALLFKYFQELLGPASIVYGFSPMIAVLVPIAICFAVGLFLLKRAG